MNAAASPDRFEQCKTCPAPAGCSAASYCVMESRFHGADQDITAPVCATCNRSAKEAWACGGQDGKPCGAQSELWGQWFLVQMYAQDELRRRAGSAEDEAPGDDRDDDRCPDCGRGDCTGEDCYEKGYRCPESSDGLHTTSWYNGERCAACGLSGAECGQS